MFYRLTLLKNFSQFLGKHLQWSDIFGGVVNPGLKLYPKYHFFVGTFQWVFQKKKKKFGNIFLHTTFRQLPRGLVFVNSFYLGKKEDQTETLTFYAFKEDFCDCSQDKVFRVRKCRITDASVAVQFCKKGVPEYQSDTGEKCDINQCSKYVLRQELPGGFLNNVGKVLWKHQWWSSGGSVCFQYSCRHIK